jgi:hypothetical protein
MALSLIDLGFVSINSTRKNTDSFFSGTANAQRRISVNASEKVLQVAACLQKWYSK